MDMQDEGKKLEKLQDDAKQFFERSLSYLKAASGKLDQKMEVVRLRTEMIGLRKAHAEALQDLGLSVYSLVKVQGQVSEAEIALAVGRVHDVEETLAAKARRIEELEAQDQTEDSQPESAVESAETPSGPKPRTPSRRPSQAKKDSGGTPAAKSPSRKTAPKKASAKKATSKKAASQKKATKKAAAKKAPAKKAPSKKAPAKTSASKKKSTRKAGGSKKTLKR